MKLLKFEDAVGVNELLKQLEIEDELGLFLGAHLTQVLRRQHQEIELQSIEFISADGCTVTGTQTNDGRIIEGRSICIPVNVRVVLTCDFQFHELELRVDIKGNFLSGILDLTSDVIVISSTKQDTGVNSLDEQRNGDRSRS